MTVVWSLLGYPLTIIGLGHYGTEPALRAVVPTGVLTEAPGDPSTPGWT